MNIQTLNRWDKYDKIKDVVFSNFLPSYFKNNFSYFFEFQISCHVIQGIKFNILESRF